MANVHIPLEHQSSPKETEIDREVNKAIEEIVTTGWTPPASDDDFWQTGTNILAAHPRVQEALAKLEMQVQDKTASEYLDIAAQQHELNEVLQMDRQWPGQRRWLGKENEEMRIVEPMTPFTFIDKLNAINVSADHEPTVTIEYQKDDEGVERMAEVERTSKLVCLGHRVVNGLCGLYAHVSQGDGTTRYERVSMLQVPMGPAWDLVRFDEWGVPVGKRYHGWRTAVLALVQKRVITEGEAIKAFGKPIDNAASIFYRQQMAEFRNGAV